MIYNLGFYAVEHVWFVGFYLVNLYCVGIACRESNRREDCIYKSLFVDFFGDNPEELQGMSISLLKLEQKHTPAHKGIRA